MQCRLGKGACSVYALQYLVQVAKYRKPALERSEIVDLLKQKVRKISVSLVNVLNECDRDNFHMIFKAKPTLDMPKYINAKTITSRETQTLKSNKSCGRVFLFSGYNQAGNT